MTTAFGKELRKLRVDKDQNINDMAKKLGISISYLSSIEAGKRRIPDDMTEKLIKIYHLSKERAELLRNAEAISSEDIEIDLSEVTPAQRQLVFALSRKLEKITDEECLALISKLK